MDFQNWGWVKKVLNDKVIPLIVCGDINDGPECLRPLPDFS